MGNGILALFLLYAFPCQLGFSSSLPHLCPNDQALALLQFKHMFTITNSSNYYPCYSSYPKKLYWNRSTDCCSWDGIYCNKTTGEVVELNLTCSRLYGMFNSNSSLFQLSSLKRLDLSQNDFYGSHISPKFGELSSLTHLDLSASEFSGPIPSEISQLSKLNVLRINDGYMLRFGPHNFKMLLNNLTQLRELELSYVNISSSFPLNFSSYLTTLRLDDALLHGILPERVFHLSNLEVLDLSSNPQLTVRFPMMKWNSSTSLVLLYLEGVNVTGKIPQSFSYLTSLRKLDLSNCNLSGSNYEPLWNLTQIEHLDLSDNHLEGPISQFSKFEKLRWLSLGGNNFTGQLEFLAFSNWTQLEYLDLSSISITGSIPSNVSGLQNLRTLYLSSNNLNGSVPSWIFSLPSLEVLDLRENHFSGNILEFKSKTLLFIYLQRNQFQGVIPKSLLNQQSLRFLILSENNLGGQIAPTICNLKMLSVLDLGGNNFKGKIPQCLGEMNEVWVLDLSKNSLSGTIDTAFRIGSQLSFFNLHGNKLDGNMPQSLSNCKILEFLDLSFNALNDTFPSWLGTLPNLRILNLRSNKLYGSIKASRDRDLFAKLIIMDLSSNGFSGNLPASLFENFKAMKVLDENIFPLYYSGFYESMIITTKGLDLEFDKLWFTNIVINLSRNKFGGYIPSVIGDLIGLRTLNLSRNGLEGLIPTSLQHLSVLESLDLSFNKIGGLIPQQLASLTSLEVLNLSHNHLVGCIPKGKQFDTFDNSSYQGNDGLRGFPVSKDCANNGAAQATTPVVLEDQGEGEGTSMISWQAILMGYGCGLTIGLSIIYMMLSTQNPIWFARMFDKLEHMIIRRIQRHLKRN